MATVSVKLLNVVEDLDTEWARPRRVTVVRENVVYMQWGWRESGSRPAERYSEPRIGARSILTVSSSRHQWRRHVWHRTPVNRRWAGSAAGASDGRPSTADAAGCRRHGNADGVRSDSGGEGRSRRMNDRRAAVKQLRLSPAVWTPPETVNFYTQQVRDLRRVHTDTSTSPSTGFSAPVSKGCTLRLLQTVLRALRERYITRTIIMT